MLTVCTYNIHAGRDHQNRASLGQITATLVEARPDVCLLQEVDRRLPRSGWVDQAGALAQALGARAYFYGRLRAGPAAFGNALLTRRAVRQVRYVPLPSSGGEPRGALGVHLDDPDLWVWNTHLGLKASWRAEQLAALEKAMAAQQTVLLGGDFNATLDEPALAAFVARAGFLPLSLDTPTFPVPGPPTSRIDFLLGRNCFTWNAGNAEAAAATTIAAPGSDHCLVWAQVTTGPPPVKPSATPGLHPPLPRSAE